MALPSSAKLVEQAKYIFEEDLEFKIEKSTHNVGNDVVDAIEEGEEFPRKQRPTKRHKSSAETLDNNDDVLSSQESFESDSLEFDPIDENTNKGKASLASLDNEITGLSAIEENKLNETPSCDSAELKRDEAMKFLKGVLHLKPTVLEGSSLSPSDFPGYRVIDLKPLRGGSLKQREEFSEIEKWLESGTKIEMPLTWDVGSRPPPRNPFDSFDFLASFQNFIPRSRPKPKPKPSADSFSAHEIDHVSTRNCLTTQEVTMVGSSKPLDELSAPIIEKVIAAAGETNTVLDISENSKDNKQL